MKINKKGKIQDKYIGNKNNINNKDISKKEKSQNILEFENNIEIRKISLPIRKNCFNSPKRKKLIIKNSESSNNNNKIIEEENIYFSFGKIKPEITNKDKYIESQKIIPNFDFEKNKNNILTEKNELNHENVSLNDANIIKRKKNNIPKPSIKNNNNKSSINLDMEKINYTLRNNDFLSNNIINKNNSIMPLTSLLNKCCTNKDEKDMKAIEEFMGNFKNKERSESLQKALNMYKRYKSLSKLNSPNKLNNSCCELNNVKNSLVNQKSEQNFLQQQRSEENLFAKKKINKKLVKVNYDIKNNNENNYYYESHQNKNNVKSNYNINNSEKKVKKYFLRKVIREEKCYRDKNGNIHVVDYKQSLIKDDKPIFNLKKNVNGKLIKKDLSHKCFKIHKISSNKPLDLKNNNKKINVEINQINNIKSYNNINNFSSINNYNNINNKNIEDKNNIYSRNNNSNKLRIINLSKRMGENDLNNRNLNNSKKCRQKIKLVKYTTNNNNIINNNKINKLPLDKINYYTVNNANSIQRNFSFQNLYHYNKYNNNNQSFYYPKNANLINNQLKVVPKRNYDYPKYNNNTDNFDNLNKNCEFNNIYYKENIYPETDRTYSLNRNNSNCSFFESKSISNNKKHHKVLKNSNSYIIFKRNGEYEIDYIKDKTYNNYNNQSNNNNYCDEIKINQNNLFNKKIISNNYYNNNEYNNNNRYINYYEPDKIYYYNHPK